VCKKCAREQGIRFLQINGFVSLQKLTIFVVVKYISSFIAIRESLGRFNICRRLQFIVDLTSIVSEENAIM
jgi:hypothetical protein